MDLKFLDNIQLKSDNNFKSIRFGKNEIYLLKFIQYKERNFSAYVKQLIRNDLEEFICKNNSLSQEEIKNLVRKEIKKILDENK